MGDGGLGNWSDGRQNKNRGFQQLHVWQDAIMLYVETCQIVQATGQHQGRGNGVMGNGEMGIHHSIKKQPSSSCTRNKANNENRIKKV